MGRSYQRQRRAKRYQRKPGRILFRTIGPFVAFAAVAVFSVASGSIPALTSTSLLGSGSGASASCNIKGNVSIETGERIYHIPGQKYYSETRISPQHGERWFCSEAEARRAGWRKSRV
jgi:hypothetical protein